MTIMQTVSGRMIDLLNPKPEDIDFRQDVAGPLARTARFGGQIPGGILSVAQHCVVGAEAILRDTGDRRLAAAFLLHDAHEAYLGDITRPTQEAIVEMLRQIVEARFGNRADAYSAARDVERAMGLLKNRLDAAIYTAAGFPFQPPAAVPNAVKDWDARMLQTERLLFLPHRTRWAWDDAPPATVQWTEKVRLWPWHEAEERYLAALATLAPAALTQRAA